MELPCDLSFVSCILFAMHRLLIPLFAFAILLTACGGGGSVKVDCEKDYWDGTVGVCLPEGWAALDRETMRQRGLPDETVAAFRSEKSVSGQFPSITITQETLLQQVSASDYSDASIRSVSVLPGYTLIDTPSATVDGEEVKLHVFSAQPVSDEPARRFYQVSTVSDGVGFTATAVTPLFVEKQLEGEITTVMKSVTFSESEE